MNAARSSVPTAVALYFLNEFRNRLIQVEESYGFRVAVEADDHLEAATAFVEKRAPVFRGR